MVCHVQLMRRQRQGLEGHCGQMWLRGTLMRSTLKMGALQLCCRWGSVLNIGPVSGIMLHEIIFGLTCMCQ